MNEDPDRTRMLNAFWDQEARLRSYLARFIENRNDIDDVCQETVLRALAATRQTVRNPAAFVFGVARNIVRRRFEHKSRSLVDLVADFTPDEHAADPKPLDDIMAEEERLARYTEATARLPPKCRRVFVMAKVFGYSHREIAGMLNISVRTVENHVATGLKRCSDALGRDDRDLKPKAEVIRLRQRR